MLEESSKFPETLEVTEARQYCQRGLLHISDEPYLFLIRGGEEMVELASAELRADQELKDSWLLCFEPVDVCKNKVINNCLLR